MTIIKFWDNEQFGYPLIEILNGNEDEFNKILNDYRKNNDDYNYDDFIEIISEYDWYIGEIIGDYEVFF